MSYDEQSKLAPNPEEQTPKLFSRTVNGMKNRFQEKPISGLVNQTKSSLKTEKKALFRTQG